MTSHLRETIASYVPAYLTRRANSDPASISAPQTETLQALVLFADVSGFTALAERLAERGSVGSEELTRCLNEYFGELTELVDVHGGDTVKFAGDALLALWPAENLGQLMSLARQVAHCAVEIQERLHDYAVADDVRLSVKICISAGDVEASILGGIYDRSEFFVAGDPISQIGAADKLMAPGDIMLTAAAWALIAAHGTSVPVTGELVRLTELKPQVGVSRAPVTLPTAVSLPALRNFLPGAIRSRIDAGQSGWLSELRALSILFINLPDLGYDTPLERAHEAMRAMQTALYRFEGSINKISVDDKGASLIAVLGLPPLSHEDDPERAVRAALAMREKLAELSFGCSIGITTGRAFCGAVGGRRRREYTVMGDVVNLSARLMQAAAGGVLCCGLTAAAAKDRLHFEQLEPIRVKGKAEPVEIHRPVEGSALTAMSWMGPVPKSKLIGRTRERETLALNLDNLLTEGQSGVVVFEGEAGIGKSALLQDLCRQGEEWGATVLRGTADSIQRSVPYRAWRRIFRDLYPLSGLPKDNRARRAHVTDRLPRDPAVRDFAPLLQSVLPLAWEDNEHTEGLVGKKRVGAMHTLVTTLLGHLTKDNPILMVVKGGQWLDSASWALLADVARDVSPLLLVMGTIPSDEPPDELTELLSRPGTERYRLGGLEPDEIRELVCHRLGVNSIDEGIVRLIRENAGGNPYFIEQLAFSLFDSGMLAVEDGICRPSPKAGDLRAWRPPATIQAAILRRIDGMSPAEQMTLKVASVVGRVFQRQIVHDIYPVAIDRNALLLHFETLHDKDLAPKVEDEEGASRDPLGIWQKFKKSIARDVTYNLMLFSQRRGLHRAVAEWYETRHAEDLSPHYGTLARHWSKAAEDRRPDPELVARAVRYHKLAAEQAIAAWAFDEGIEYLQEAIELVSSMGETEERARLELELQLALGTPLLASYGYGAPIVERAFHRARDLAQVAGGQDLLLPTLHGLWAVHLGRGEYLEAEARGRDTLQIGKRQRDGYALMDGHRTRGYALFWLGRLTDAAESLDRGLRIASGGGIEARIQLTGLDAVLAARAAQGVTRVVLGDIDVGVHHASRAVARARGLKHPYSLAYALCHEAVCRQLILDVKGCYRLATEAFGIGNEHGFATWRRFASVVSGWALPRLGEPDEGADMAVEALREWQEAGCAFGLTYLHALVADAQRAAKRPAAALETVWAGLDAPLLHEERVFEPELHRLRGDLLLATAEADEAEGSLRAARDLARRTGSRLQELRIAMSLARLWSRAGRRSAAYSLLESSYNSFLDGFESPILRRARGMLNKLADE